MPENKKKNVKSKLESNTNIRSNESTEVEDHFMNSQGPCPATVSGESEKLAVESSKENCIDNVEPDRRQEASYEPKEQRIPTGRKGRIWEENKKFEEIIACMVHPNSMIVKVFIHGKGGYDALVDSGAQCSLINYKLAESLSLKCSQSELKVSGIGQGAQRFNTMQIYVNQIEMEQVPMKPMIFNIIPNYDISFDIILGRHFFEINKLTINFKERVLTHSIQDYYTMSLKCEKLTEVPPSPLLKVRNEPNLDGIPCRAGESTTLRANKVNNLQIKCCVDWLDEFVKVNDLLCCLELNEGLVEDDDYKTGIIDPISTQSIMIIPPMDIQITEGERVGEIFTVKYHEGKVLPHNENFITTILNDEQVVSGINDAPDEDYYHANPNAIFDEIPKFPDDLEMHDTPPDLLLGEHARLFPPRDMLEFDAWHRQWEEDGFPPDGLQDELSMDQIVNTFKVLANILTEEQLERFYRIIQKYRVAFVRNEGDLAVGTVGQVDLKLKPGHHTNLRVKPTKWNTETNKIVQDICDQYLRAGIIKKSSGPYSSRVHVVYRKNTEGQQNSKPRMVVDFRKINSALVKCSKYLQSVDTILMKLGIHKYYSKMDLKGAYHQLAILEKAKEISSIVTMESQYVFNVLPFGISVAVGYFEIVMQAIFSSMSYEELVHYLDDCLVPADDVTSMLDRLEKFLFHVVKHRIKLSPDKCDFFSSDIEFLGYRITDKGIQKSSEYTKSIMQLKKPHTMHDLMRFLGLVNYQRRFIPNCSEILKPLISAVTPSKKGLKSKVVTWNSEMEKSFQLIKEKLVEDVTLALPDNSPEASPLMLFVDASKVAVGSSLKQQQQGEIKTITYMSKLLSKTELRYSTYDKELLGLIDGIESHRQYLAGRKFQLYTDCKNIVYLFKMKHACPRLLRAMDRLGEYDFEVLHIPGKDNITSDILSRLDGMTQAEYHRNLVDGQGEEYVPPNFEEVKVPGGANSMYEVIADAIYRYHKTRVTIDSIRKSLVDEVIDHPEKYGIREMNKSMRDVKSMAKSGVAPSLIMLSVAANIYKIIFKVWYGLEQPLIFVPQLQKGKTTNNNYPTAYVLCKGQGSHYDILKPENSPEPQEELVNVMEEVDLLHWKKDDTDEESEILNIALSLESCDLNINDLNDDNTPIRQLRRRESFEPSKHHLDLRPRRTQLMCSHGHTQYDHGLLVGAPGDKEEDKSGLCALIDTGSTTSVISKSALECLQKNNYVVDTIFSENIGTVQPLGPTLIKPIGCARILLKYFLDSPEIMDLIVMRDEDINVCFIFGGDFLENNNISIDCVGHGQGNSIDVIFRTVEQNSMRIFDPMQVGPYNIEECNQLAVINYLSNVDDVPDSDLSHEENFDINKELSYDEIHTLQKSSQLVRELYQAIKYNYRVPNLFKSSLGRVRIRNNIVTFKGIPVITKEFMIEYICTIHDHLGHLGKLKIINLIKDRYWCPGWQQMVLEITRSCPMCLTNKAHTTHVAPPVYKKIARNPYDLVCLDVLSLPKSKSGNVAALVVADHASKFLQVFALKNHKAETIVEKLTQYIRSSVRCPLAFLSDNAPEFRSEKYTEFCEQRGIERIFSSKYNPQTNGFSERNCGIIVNQLKFMMSNAADWDIYMDKIVVTHNNTVSTTTGVTPCSFIYNKSHFIEPEQLLPPAVVEVWHKGNPDFAPFELNDEVLIKLHHVGNLAIHKFKPRFEGIFKVIKVRSQGVLYNLQRLSNESDIHKNIHFNDLREFKRPRELINKSVTFNKFYKKWFDVAFSQDFDYQDEDYNNYEPNLRVRDNKQTILPDNKPLEEHDDSEDDTHYTYKLAKAKSLLELMSNNFSYSFKPLNPEVDNSPNVEDYNKYLNDLRIRGLDSEVPKEHLISNCETIINNLIKCKSYSKPPKFAVPIHQKIFELYKIGAVIWRNNRTFNKELKEEKLKELKNEQNNEMKQVLKFLISIYEMIRIRDNKPLTNLEERSPPITHDFHSPVLLQQRASTPEGAEQLKGLVPRNLGITQNRIFTKLNKSKEMGTKGINDRSKEAYDAQAISLTDISSISLHSNNKGAKSEFVKFNVKLTKQKNNVGSHQCGEGGPMSIKGVNLAPTSDETNSENLNNEERQQILELGTRRVSIDRRAHIIKKYEFKDHLTVFPEVENISHSSKDDYLDNWDDWEVSINLDDTIPLDEAPSDIAGSTEDIITFPKIEEQQTEKTNQFTSLERSLNSSSSCSSPWKEDSFAEEIYEGGMLINSEDENSGSKETQETTMDTSNENESWTDFIIKKFLELKSKK